MNEAKPFFRQRTTKIIILGLIFVVLVGTPFWLTAKPESCASCHTMEPYYASWKSSFHNKWPCRDCHQKKGTLGHISFQAGFIYEVAAEIFNIEDISNPGSQKPTNDSCIGRGCHTGKTILTTKMNHGLHVSKYLKKKARPNRECAYCHKNLIHDPFGPTPMKRCAECHEVGKGSDCAYCHKRAKQPEDYTEHFKY